MHAKELPVPANQQRTVSKFCRARPLSASRCSTQHKFSLPQRATGLSSNKPRKPQGLYTINRGNPPHFDRCLRSPSASWASDRLDGYVHIQLAGIFPVLDTTCGADGWIWCVSEQEVDTCMPFVLNSVPRCAANHAGPGAPQPFQSLLYPSVTYTKIGAQAIAFRLALVIIRVHLGIQYAQPARNDHQRRRATIAPSTGLNLPVSTPHITLKLIIGFFAVGFDFV
ncbi:hypothetical protein CC86DRAFT_56051 [Ophiobolus disseminans]|uniref:Uncharacterized protein n=1 Tax=Ophiobolus disseminans TaxID=1469910 RepID=A0A6A6ZVR9_9PLEO|nr:hypothetical protein CC86DRAFT_56051 [Ophiobolus disseminans]